MMPLAKPRDEFSFPWGGKKEQQNGGKGAVNFLAEA
jgi:hypothetical protein